MYVDSMTKSELIALIKTSIIDTFHKYRNDVNTLFPLSNSKDFCTIKELCEILKVTKPTIHNWVKKGTLTKYKINGRVLYKKNEIDEILKR